MQTVTVVVLLALPLLIAIPVRSRLHPALLAYSILVVVQAVVTAWVINSKIRLLLPAFGLMLPVAMALAARRPSTQVAVVIIATLASAWFGAYCLVIYPHAI